MPRRSVLILEDQFFLADDLSREASDADFSVIGPFATLKQGLKALRTTSPDCAILDVKLRDGLAYEIAQELTSAAIPFIFVSGYPRRVLPAEFQKRPFIEKPCSPRATISLVKARLGDAASAEIAA